jgi:hypothetical protein
MTVTKNVTFDILLRVVEFIYTGDCRLKDKVQLFSFSEVRSYPI